ncbi:MAG: FKBP-type peptidyl-prolyl cis-trans isomerase [Bacteroidota bacterium]
MVKRLSILCVLLGWIGCAVYAQEEGKLENKVDSMSYALGVDLGNNLSSLDLKLNSDLVFRGLVDGMAKANNLTDTEVRRLLQQFQVEAQAAQRQQMIEKENSFLAENRAKEGVKETESGLQYIVLQEADGPKPASASTKVRVHYEGRLVDGSIFDSSVQRGEPIEFALNGVISGWTEGVQLMSVGSKYRFFIPYKMAYGEQGRPPRIGPFSTLIFDIELIDIVE